MARPGRAEIKTAAVTACGPDWRWDSKGSPWRHLILWVVTAGQGTMHHAGQVYSVQAGDCYVFRMWHRCVGSHDPRTPLTVYWCEFRLLDAAGRPVELSDALADRLPAIHRRLTDLPFLTRVFDRAIRYANRPGHQAEADLWMEATLQELASQDAQPVRSGLSLEHHEAIGGLVAAIRREPGRAWSIAAMAGQLHYSPDHFTRVFRAVMGESPRDFLVRTRIEEAKQMLSMSSYGIGRIADLLGYADIYHFSKQFKARTGIAPSRFRHRG